VLVAPEREKSSENSRHLRLIIFASSMGALIEWYDFYIYAIMTVVITGKFFPGSLANSFLASLAALWVGFAVRPFGALVFGHLGDAIGRKYTFLATLLVMGCSTCGLGLVPSYTSIGYAAPALLVFLRCAQGLALGGEYGGCATYVAEHAPNESRAFHTAFLQTMATVGLLVALLAVTTVQATMSSEAFISWGWRIPFLSSAPLVGLSLWIRSRMDESPIFLKIRDAGMVAKFPLSAISRRDWGTIATLLFGAVAGQAVIAYTAQIYQIYFMTRTLGVPLHEAYMLAAWGIVLGTPFYFLWARVSDRHGRKPVILSGCAIAVVCLFPIYRGMSAAVSIGPNGMVVNGTLMIAMLAAQMFITTMVSGPMIAMLAEAFPAQVRYTCMSIPYHIGNGEFGGLTPLVATSLSIWWVKKHPGSPSGIYIGLVWPIAIALATLIIGAAFLKETVNNPIQWETEG
jgi:MFS family permease